MAIVNANVLFNVTSGTALMGQGVVASINCLKLSAFSPRQAWIKTNYHAGDGTTITYTVTMEPTDPEIDATTIKGWMVQQEDDVLIIDAVSAQAILDACNACCGDVPALIPPYYTSGVPAYVYPVASKFCVTRADEGSAWDHELFTEDYIVQTIGGARIVSSTGTSTKYEVLAYGTPAAVGADTVAAGACS